MGNKLKINILESTLYFCIVGFFISGFTAILLFGIQLLLTQIGIECVIAMKIIYSISWFAMFITPILFIKKIISNKNIDYKKLRNKLLLFNVLEYFFIQISFGSLLTNSSTLCYGSGGQNGIEFAFSGWLALPILFFFSYVFKKILIKQINV